MAEGAAVRADAVRNRARILEIAREGADAAAPMSMAELARRAGVGMATLYRHFPSRRTLVEALYAEQVDEICAAADAAAADPAPGDALVDWLLRFTGFVAGKHDLAAELLQSVAPDDEVFEGSRQRVLRAGRPLLAAARDAGQVRRDLSLEQILDLVVAVTGLRADPAETGPMLAAVLDGIRVRGAD